MTRGSQVAAYAVALSMLGLTSTAAAKKPPAEAQASIQSHTVTLTKLSERDERRVATAEIGMAHGWLGEAQSYVDNRRKREQLGWALDRLSAVMPLIEALILRADAEEAATAAIARADAKAAEVSRVEAEVEELRRRRAALETEVAK